MASQEEYDCHFCSDSFDSPQGRASHMRQKHPNQWEVYQEQQEESNSVDQEAVQAAQEAASDEGDEDLAGAAGDAVGQSQGDQGTVTASAPAEAQQPSDTAQEAMDIASGTGGSPDQFNTQPGVSWNPDVLRRVEIEMTIEMMWPVDDEPSALMMTLANLGGMGSLPNASVTDWEEMSNHKYNTDRHGPIPDWFQMTQDDIEELVEQSRQG